MRMSTGPDRSVVEVERDEVEQQGDQPSFALLVPSDGSVQLSRPCPQGSWQRLQAELPNKCWQADVTHVGPADGSAIGHRPHQLEPTAAVHGRVPLTGPESARRGYRVPDV
jgi:hypothetical protein